jgi:hypothetical protein
MLRDELLKHLVLLPPDADIVIEVGRTEVDVMEIESVSYPTERHSIALRPYPADLRDAITAQAAATRKLAGTTHADD